MQRHHLLYLALIFCLTIFNACDTGDSSDEQQTDAEQFTEPLQKALEETAALYNAPGAVLVTSFTDGSIWTGATGVSEIAETEEPPMDTSLHFRIGSVTKTFIGTATLLLVQREYYSLDDTLQQLLPDVIAGGDEITIRNLLSHTSGLPDYTHDESFQDTYITHPETVWVPEDLIGIAMSEEPWFAPGEAAAYSNTNYILLGMVIEQVSGQSIEVFLEENVFSPLGLSDTVFPSGTSMPEKFAHGYLDLNLDGQFTTDEDVTAQHPSALWTAGAIVSTPFDLLAWVAELNDSILLDQDIQSERLAFEIPIEGFPGGDGFFGLGIAKLAGCVGHTGAVIGYTTAAFRYRGVDFAVLCNGYHLSGDAANIANKILGEAIFAVFGDKLEI